MGIKKISNTDENPKPTSAIDKFSNPKKPIATVIPQTKPVQVSSLPKKGGNIVNEVIHFFNGRTIEL